MATGRKAAVDKVGLENIGLYVENGAVVTDEHLCTNVPGVYAIGDINGKVMQAHTAYREGEVAVNNMNGENDVIPVTVKMQVFPDHTYIGLQYSHVPSFRSANPTCSCPLASL